MLEINVNMNEYLIRFPFLFGAPCETIFSKPKKYIIMRVFNKPFVLNHFKRKNLLILIR